MRLTPCAIYLDQTAFIKVRHSLNNVCKFSIIKWQIKKYKTIIASFNAETAFVKAHWKFLFKALNIFDGKSFTPWIKVLCSSPMAAVITNGIRWQGFRQGWLQLLTPSAFAISLEPLATAILPYPELQRYYNHRPTQYNTLYVLLYLPEPSKWLHTCEKTSYGSCASE